MSVRTSCVTFAALAAVCTPFHAGAVEPLATTELIDHCSSYDADPEGPDAIFCVRYVQGFIDGAVTTDALVTLNIADEVDRDESFTERAMRTRLGRRLERYGPSYYADFCLSETVPLSTVVKQVIEALLEVDVATRQPLARDVVFGTLRSRYPCETDDGR